MIDFLFIATCIALAMTATVMIPITLIKIYLDND